jgi:hypothetical protein
MSPLILRCHPPRNQSSALVFMPEHVHLLVWSLRQKEWNAMNVSAA